MHFEQVGFIWRIEFEQHFFFFANIWTFNHDWREILNMHVDNRSPVTMFCGKNGSTAHFFSILLRTDSGWMHNQCGNHMLGITKTALIIKITRITLFLRLKSNQWISTSIYVYIESRMLEGSLRLHYKFTPQSNREIRMYALSIKFMWAIHFIVFILRTIMIKGLYWISNSI